MKKILQLVTVLLFTLNLNGQYTERFQLTNEAILFNKTNKIASVTTTVTSDSKTSTLLEQYDKNGMLAYKRQSGSNIRSYTYKYDKKLRLTEIIDSTNDLVFNRIITGFITFKYYDNGLLKERNLDGKKIEFLFDKTLNKLTEKYPDEEDNTSILEYYYDSAFRLVKEFAKDEENEETIYCEYDNLDREVKVLSVSVYTGGYDSITTTTTYNVKGLIEKESQHKVNGAMLFNDDGTVEEGSLETTVTNRYWLHEYDAKGRITRVAAFEGTSIKPLYEETHTFTTANNIETETIITVSGASNHSEEVIVYNGPKGLKGESTLKDTRLGRTKESTTKFTYTFH
jgi:uncharacterized protein YxeA